MQAYFEGRGMVKMVVNISPALEFFDESVEVLKFTAIANQVSSIIFKNYLFIYWYDFSFTKIIQIEIRKRLFFEY